MSSNGTRVWPWIAVAALWTGLLAGLAWEQFRAADEVSLALARAEAVGHFNKDLAYRRWAAGHGGVYVPVSAETPPNPYLAHLPARDVTTTSGRELTLVNPAYMTRQVHELSAEQYGVQGHITSLDALNPVNTPDAWERERLEAFARGEGGTLSLEEVGDEVHLRAMWPLVAEQRCLGCHGHQGYEVGEIRGGIGVSLPFAPFAAIAWKSQRSTLITFGLVWFVGLIGLAAARRRVDGQFVALEAARERETASENRYRALFEQTTVGIGMADPDTGIMSACNRALAGFVERAPDEIIGQHQRILHPPVQGEVTPAFERHRYSGSDEALDVPLLTRSGAVRHAEVKATLIDVDGRAALLGFFQDVTERRNAERALRDHESRLRAIFEAAKDVAFVVADGSPEALILEFSAGAEALFGYAQDEVRGRTVADLFVEERRGAVAAIQDRIRKGQIGFQGEVAVLRKSGEEFPALLTVHPLFDADGDLFGGVGVVIDLTQRKKLEEELRQAQKMEALGTLAGGIAHDFNNILGAIIGFTELELSGPALPESTDESLREILKAALRAEKLVSQILTFSRRREELFSLIELREPVEEAVELLRNTLPSTIRLTSTIADDIGAAYAEPTQIHQICMNLGTNAGHALRERGGELTIGLRRSTLPDGSEDAPSELEPGPYGVLTVADDGPGVAPELLPRLFDPFFTTKGPGEGTGLGLAVAHGIAVQHGGAIVARNRAPGGFEVRVFLPLQATEKVVASAPDVAPKESVPCGSGRVLFVDDEESLVRLGRLLLESLGYEVSAYSDSRAALAAFERAPADWDILMTDQTMPGLTGAELVSRVHAIRPELPAVICTGYSQTLDAAGATAAGASAFLVKPIERGELARVLASLARATGSPPS